MVKLVSPLQAEDGRLSAPSVASQLWDVLVDQAAGLRLSEISDLTALPEEDLEPVRVECATRTRSGADQCVSARHLSPACTSCSAARRCSTTTTCS